MMATGKHISIAEKSDHCAFIDGWRGVAILLVIAVHTSQMVTSNGHRIFFAGWTEKLFQNSAKGVHLFFILSAFTLFNSSYRRFQTDSRPATNFYLRRAFRILPLWWIVVVIFSLLNGVPFWIGNLSATFLFGFLRFDNRFDVVPGGWSLFVEETFYLMLPFIFGKINTLRKASYFTGFLFLAAVLWRIVAPFAIADTNSFVGFFPLCNWYVFGIGIVLFYVIRSEKWQDRVTDGKEWKLDLVALCSTSLMVTSLSPLISVMFALCIYASSRQGTIISRIISNRLLMRYGIYCYSMYLSHFLVLRFFMPQIHALIGMLSLGDSPVEVQFSIAFPIVCLILMPLGYLSFNLIEKPSVTLGKMVIAWLNDGVGVESCAAKSEG